MDTREFHLLKDITEIKDSVFPENPFLVWEEAHYQGEKWISGKWKNEIPEIYRMWQTSNSSALQKFVGDFGLLGDELGKTSTLEQIARLNAIIDKELKRFMNLVEKIGLEWAEIFLDLWGTKEKEKELKKLKNKYLFKFATSEKITEEQIIKAKEYPFEQLIQVDSKGFAKCPFHFEKTSSFFVRNNFGHCFGCNKTVDTIQFIIETEKLNFISAVKKLST